MSLDLTTHKNILLKILKDIYTDNTIGPILGFKGGTAAYLLYNLNRFSVDLDFDLLDKEKEDYVFERIKKIISPHGKVKKAEKKRFNLLFVLSYEEKARNVKVEINRRAFGSRYEVKSYLGISMKVMVQEDMAAHKLMAMSERLDKTNRDMFDVWFLLKNDWPINKEMVEKRAGISFKKFLEKCISSLEKIENRKILDGIGEFLDEKTKAWTKEHLIKDLLFFLKLKLDDEKRAKT